MCQDRWCGFLYSCSNYARFIQLVSFIPFALLTSFHFTSLHSTRFVLTLLASLRSLRLRDASAPVPPAPLVSLALFKLRFVQTTLVPPPRCFGSTRFVFTLSRVAPVLAPAAPLPPLRSYLSRYRTGMIKNMSNIGEMTERSGEWSRRRNE